MITIIQAPATYTPAYNPMNYIVESDNITEPSFQYVFDLYVNGSMVSRHRLPPRFGSNVAMLDVSNIVQAYVSHDFVFSDTAFDKNPNSWASVYIKFGEEYSVAGIITTYIDLSTSATSYAVNASIEFLDFINWNTNQYFFGSSRKFLTSIPTPSVTLNSSLWLYFKHEIPQNIVQCGVGVYAIDGTLLNVNTFTPTSLSNSVVGDRFLRVSVGTKQLKELFGSTFFDGGAYYDVAVIDITSSFTFETKRINIIEESCIYDNIPVHFLNKLGGFDVFNFKLASYKESDIERKTYKSSVGTFNVSNEFTYASTDRSINLLSTSSQDIIKANSDWISEEESVWLKELVTSPVVFAEINSKVIPIVIKESKYVFNKKENKKLFNLQITFNYGNENYRQSY